MKRALVTGGKGFCGRHIVPALEARGYHVDCVDKADKHDCRDFFDLCTTKYELVAHLAAFIGGRVGIDQTPLAVAVNVELDAAMFRWAVQTHQRRVVYFSSSAAYPIALQQEPGRRLCESCLRFDKMGQPDATYGFAKLSGEVLARYAAAEGVAVHVLRPFSGYGPGQSLDYPFPCFIERAKRGDDPFEVWGTGEQARDFVHISDVIGCTLAVVDQDYREPLNIGTGRATTFAELAELVAPGVEKRFLPGKPTGVQWRVADPTRMLQVYTPKVSLEQGIAEALA